MKVKMCETCGKVFFCRSENRMYCSKECRDKAIKRKREEYGQLCWRCKKACGGCSWSGNKTPIKNWDAEPHIVKDEEGDIRSYKIKKCPEFIKG